MTEKQPSQEMSHFQHSTETDNLRETGIPWLGEIPAHWTVSKVKWQFEVQLGKMLDEDDISGDNLAPYLRNKDVQWWNINTENLPQMDFGPGERRKYNLHSGDVLVCEGGEIGRSAVWTNDEIECYYQKALHRVRPLSSNQNSKFFCYFMQFAAGNGIFVANTNRSTIDHLTAIKLKNQEIPIPPEREQKLIVDFLDRRTARIDALVAKQKRLLDLLDERRQAFITRAVTEGLSSSVATKETETDWLDEIPEHWDVTKLMYLVRDGTSIVYGILKPGPNVEDGIPYIGAGDVIQNRLTLDELPRTSTEIAEGYERSQMNAGELVYAIRGSFGSVSVLPDALDGVNLSRDAARIAPKENIDPYWLCWALRSEPSQRQFEVNEMGSAVTGVNIRDLKRLVLPFPPAKEQEEIATHLSQYDSKLQQQKDAVRRLIDLLEEKRQALITAAVTGQIDGIEERGAIQDQSV